ncbi:MAG: hypothetical protein LBL07_03725 [Tannerella sp.]|jgi:hypothetical protein|nr:hypothetical protein [Tannerella sp.]
METSKAITKLRFENENRSINFSFHEGELSMEMEIFNERDSNWYFSIDIEEEQIRELIRFLSERIEE